MPAHFKSDKGTMNPNCKLTEQQVRRIRTLHAEYELSYKLLGQRFGVGWEHIRAICKRKAWAHVTLVIVGLLSGVVPATAQVRGGSNVHWYRADATGACAAQEHIVARYHVDKPAIDAMLAQMHAVGQRRLRIMLWHSNSSSSGGNGWILTSDSGQLVPQESANLVALLTAVKQIGFEEAIIAFAPMGVNAPEWWTTWREDSFEENWLTIVNTRLAVQSVGIPYLIDLGNEMIPHKDWNGPILTQYTQRLWYNYTYWYGTGDTIGFSMIGIDAANRVQKLASIYGLLKPQTMDLHFYGYHSRDASEYTQFVDAHNALRSVGYTMPWIVGEVWYHDSAAAADIRRAIQKTGRPVKFLLQWPWSRSQQCATSGGDVISPVLYSAYLNKAF